MAIEERWATVTNGARVHYLDSGPGGGDPGMVPLLYVHGAIGTAEDFAPHLERHRPRRCLALSMRGMGRSDTPPAGYAFDDNVADIEAVAAAAGLPPAALFGFSRGAPCVLEFALRLPDGVRGLVLGDHGASLRRLDAGWVAATAEIPEGRARAAARAAIQRESADVDLWPRLPELHCPVLVLRGGTRGSMLSPETQERYLGVLRHGRAEVLPAAGHVLWQPDVDAFVAAVERFARSLDASPAVAVRGCARSGP